MEKYKKELKREIKTALNHVKLNTSEKDPTNGQIELLTEILWKKISKMYTEEECRNMVFDYAQFVIDTMDEKIESKPVGVWFDYNKKHIE